MSDPPTIELPVGQTKAARRERKAFLKRYQHLLDESRRQVALTILIWGPNPQADSPVARKRVQIRDRLTELNHNALFSEDLPRTGASLTTEEFAQAQSADLIVVLVEDSLGALGEAHDFGNHPDLSHKMFVLAPSTWRAGYSAQGALKDLEDGYGGVHWYVDDDIRECRVLGRAVARAEARRQIRFRAGRVS